MATYLVLRRMKLDDVHLPNETVTLDPAEKGTGTLLSRGYITPVPDNYPSAAKAKAEKPSEASQPEPDDDLKELMQNTRGRLNELALEAGVEDVLEMPDKRTVAEALLAKLSDQQ